MLRSSITSVDYYRMRNITELCKNTWYVFGGVMELLCRKIIAELKNSAILLIV